MSEVGKNKGKLRRQYDTRVAIGEVQVLRHNGGLHATFSTFTHLAE